MNRFIVIVLDGFGMGAMADAKEARPGDENASTLGSILKDHPDACFPTLEKLGLMNAFGSESEKMKFNPDANFGKSELMHWGADTFMGHQEIMGTRPQRPLVQAFQEKIDEIKDHLEETGHKVEVRSDKGLKYLIVDDYVTVADNIDADPGMAYNCTAPLDYISFDKELDIGKRVREIAKVNRVIPFGGSGTTLQDILNAEDIKDDKFIGFGGAASGSYKHDYQCRHLGYGVDQTVQAPTILTEMGIPVTLIGKVADVVINDGGKSISCVPTEEVMEITYNEVNSMKRGFICTNVQETDLAGHDQDSTRYMDRLNVADAGIGRIIPLLTEDDIMIVMADHGNDPDIGHNKHTRENVPLLVWRKGLTGVHLGLRKTLSDVGATVCDAFDAPAPQNGTSFYDMLQLKK